MKIAVTYEDGQIFQHFGHTAQFKLYEVADGKVVRAEVVDTNGGEVLFVVDNDREKALSHIIAEALVYPDLKDEELMKSYDCFDFTDMPSLVFDDINDYNYVAEVVMKVCGMASAESEDEEIEEAKN